MVGDKVLQDSSRARRGSTVEMRAYLQFKAKDLNVQVGEDCTIYQDDVPGKNTEYVVRFKCELVKLEKTQVNDDEEDEDSTYHMQRIGDVFMVRADFDPTTGLVSDEPLEAVPAE